MATEKILNTRIGLKIDTLANWSKTENQFVLKEGEVAFATVAATAGNGLTEPVIMAKIGDGTNTFNTLGWDFYAKASDVYGWAKKEKLELSDIPQEVINGIDTDTNTTYAFSIVDGKLQVVATQHSKGQAGAADIIATLDIITPDELTTALGSYYTKTEADNKFVAKETGKSLIENTKITKLDGISEGATKVEASTTNGNIKIDGVETTVYTLPTIDTGVMDVQGQGAIAVVGEDTKTVSLGLDNDNVILSQSNAGLKARADITVSGSTPKTVNDESTVVTGTMSASGLTISPDFTNVATPKAIENVRGEIEDALEEAKQYADDNDANTEYHVEYDSTNKKIKLVAGADASKMEIPTDDFIKDGMIQSVEIKDNNLVITWNTDADNAVTEIPLTELVDVMTGVDGTTITVSVSADDKISAEIKTGSIKDGHIATDAAIAKGKLASDVQTSLGLADTALQKADITTGGANGTIAVKGADVAVKGLGSAAYTEASAYATSAQGTKADNAAAAIATYGDIVTHDADEFKTVQTAVTVPSDAAGKFVTSIAQNANGEVSVTYGQISAENIGDLEVPAYTLEEDHVTADNGHNGAVTWALKKIIGENSSYVGGVELLAHNGLKINHLSPSGINPDTSDMDGSTWIGLDDGIMTKINSAPQNLIEGDDSIDITLGEQSGTPFTKINVADGGITTDKIADHAVGAHQTKACQDYSGDDAEVWVFDCGSATVNV